MLPLSPTAQKFQVTLSNLGFDNTVVELADSTRTAKEAASAVGCEVGQIAKSLVFRTSQTHRPVLVITSGSNRVSEKLVAEYLGEPLEKADADFVRQQTGYAIGGIPPIVKGFEVFIDEDLLQYEEIWAAAGTPYAVFKLTPAQLQKMAGDRVVKVKQ